MRKDILKICLMVLPVLTACDSMLDIKPEYTLTEREVFAKEGLAEAALGDAYRGLYNATTGFAYTYGDFTTDNTTRSQTYAPYATGNVLADDASVSTLWAEHYAAINLANSLIEKIPVYGQYAVQKQQQHIAEAKFIRALLYFQLLKYFAPGALQGEMQNPGVPLQLKAYDGYIEGDVIPRSTIDQVYAQVLKDLDEAYEVLPVNYGNTLDNRSRATRGAVDALRSRVYLYMRNYEKAAASAAVVLQQPGLYTLATDLMVLFPPNDGASAGTKTMHNEIIFGYPSSSNTMSSNGLSIYYFKLYYWVNTDFLNLYQPDDLRRTQLIFRGYIDGSDPERSARLTTFKFNNSYGYDNVPMFRLAEVMLTRAEALARTTGVDQEAVDLLNAVYLRSNPGQPAFTLADFPTTESFIDRVLLERRLELAYEGHYRFDLIRTNRPLANPDIDPLKYVLPIPLTEVLISNGVIKQNLGYD